jgi:putative ABC transport system substrate-binding protein
MKRREFVTLVAGAAFMWPTGARAQRPRLVIGFLGSQAAAPPRNDPQTIVLHQGFLDYGLIQDRDFIFERRLTGGADERFPEFAGELARLHARMNSCTATTSQLSVLAISLASTVKVSPEREIAIAS